MKSRRRMIETPATRLARWAGQRMVAGTFTPADEERLGRRLAALLKARPRGAGR